MTRDFKVPMRWSEGYYPNQALSGEGSRILDSLMPPSKNMWIEGPNKARSWDGMASFGSFGNKVMALVGEILGTLTTGNIIRFRDGMAWVVGSGPVKIGSGGAGTSLGTASANLQFSNALGSLTMAGIPKAIGTPGLFYATRSGLLRTDPNALNADDIIAGRNNGLISIKISACSLDQGVNRAISEGNASEPSVPVLFNDQAAIIRFPTNPIPGRLAAWRIYSTFRGFGKFGPWFFLTQVPVIGAAESSYPGKVTGAPAGEFAITWSDGDLKSIFAPIDHDPPPAGTHVFSLGDVMVVVSGAGRLNVSKPGFPEAYPPDFEAFLDPQEAVISIRGRPSDGWLYLGCRNSLHTVSLNEDPIVPIIPRSEWGQTGVANPNAMCLVNNVLYVYSGEKLFNRTSGIKDQPDKRWAIPVESEPSRLGWTDEAC